MPVVTEPYINENINEKAALHEAITRRARELWQQRGCVDGHAEEDWAQAEAEVMERFARQKYASTGLLTVRAGNVVYTCRYSKNCDTYKPGDLYPGEPVNLRFVGEKIYLRFRGRELETTIVRRSRQSS